MSRLRASSESEGGRRAIEGSVLLGYGFTCYEECVYNEDGKHMNPSFRDYRFPTALDMPHIKTIICSEVDPDGPMGAKEAGEGSTAPVGSAIGNAINYATGLHPSGTSDYAGKIVARAERIRKDRKNLLWSGRSA